MLPPKLGVFSRIKLVLKTKPLGSQRFVLVLFILQFILMGLTSFEFSNIDNTYWLSTLFDGLPVWVYGSIFLVFAISVFISLKESPFGLFPFRPWEFGSFIYFFFRFVHFGGDDGENIAVTKFLLNGHITPFLDLHGSENIGIGVMVLLKA
jgi:hypothetical protein